MHHLWWIPSLIIVCAVHSWLSKYNNEVGGKWMIYTFIWGAVFQLWWIVSRISKNIVFDAMLYDNIMFLAYSLTLILLGCGDHFAKHQWFGVLLILIGSIVMRIGIK